jgi:hypothetical protein
MPGSVDAVNGYGERRREEAGMITTHRWVPQSGTAWRGEVYNTHDFNRLVGRNRMWLPADMWQVGARFIHPGAPKRRRMFKRRLSHPSAGRDNIKAGAAQSERL